MNMASYLLGFVLYENAPSLQFKIQLTKEHSPSFRGTTSDTDDDFFNEPSVMRVKLTAAAANKQSAPSTVAVRSTDNYTVTARGAGLMHYAAMSA
jgi:hypothetical protein